MRGLLTGSLLSSLQAETDVEALELQASQLLDITGGAATGGATAENPEEIELDDEDDDEEGAEAHY
jgi:hypothetical protein